MSIDLSGISPLAVIISLAAYFLLGAVWFAKESPLGRAWIAASGYTSPTSGMSASNAFYLYPLVTCLVAVVAMHLLVRATGTDTVSEGLILGLVVGIGVAASTIFSAAAFEFSKPSRWTWGIIDAAYHVVGLTIAAIVLAVVR
jgi:hypothetical protein